MPGPYRSVGQGEGAAAPSDPQPDATGPAAPERPVLLWDPLVRLTHWGIALAVLANGLILKPGSAIHIWIGWAVAALLAARLIWGLIGPPEARFSAFPPRPLAAMSHLRALMQRRVREHRSHNPAGALMAYALWAALAVTLATGLVMTGGRSPIAIAEEKAAVAAGDWSVLVKADSDGDDGDENQGLGHLAESLHEGAVNLMLFLAMIHVAGVAVESRALGRNLLRPMLTGAPGRQSGRKSGGHT